MKVKFKIRHFVLSPSSATVDGSREDLKNKQRKDVIIYYYFDIGWHWPSCERIVIIQIITLGKVLDGILHDLARSCFFMRPLKRFGMILQDHDNNAKNCWHLS